jgi:alkylation response protein AidB-like acyl-CoA dehydrogenase
MLGEDGAGLDIALQCPISSCSNAAFSLGTAEALLAAARDHLTGTTCGTSIRRWPSSLSSAPCSPNCARPPTVSGPS